MDFCYKNMYIFAIYIYCNYFIVQFAQYYSYFLNKKASKELTIILF